jgi:hypothetical protein
MAGPWYRAAGGLLLLPLPLDQFILETPWIDPRVRQRNLTKSSRKRVKSTYSSPGLGVWRLSTPLLFTVNIQASRLTS